VEPATVRFARGFGIGVLLGITFLALSGMASLMLKTLRGLWP